MFLFRHHRAAGKAQAMVGRSLSLFRRCPADGYGVNADHDGRQRRALLAVVSEMEVESLEQLPGDFPQIDGDQSRT